MEAVDGESRTILATARTHLRWVDPSSTARAISRPGADADPTDLGGFPLVGRKEVVRVTTSCTACGACLATCPERALRRAPKRPLVVDSACTACWACIEICPAGAIEAVWVGPGATSGAGA